MRKLVDLALSRTSQSWKGELGLVSAFLHSSAATSPKLVVAFTLCLSCRVLHLSRSQLRIINFLSRLPQLEITTRPRLMHGRPSRALRVPPRKRKLSLTSRSCYLTLGMLVQLLKASPP